MIKILPTRFHDLSPITFFYIFCNNFSNMTNQEKIEALIDEALSKQKQGDRSSLWDCLVVRTSETGFLRLELTTTSL